MPLKLSITRRSPRRRPECLASSALRLLVAAAGAEAARSRTSAGCWREGRLSRGGSLERFIGMHRGELPWCRAFTEKLVKLFDSRCIQRGGGTVSYRGRFAGSKYVGVLLNKIRPRLSVELLRDDLAQFTILLHAGDILALHNRRNRHQSQFDL